MDRLLHRWRHDSALFGSLRSFRMMDIESYHLNIDNRPNLKRERRVQSTSASDQATFPIPFQAQHCLCASNHLVLN